VKRARHNRDRVKRSDERGTRHASPPTIDIHTLGPWRSPRDPADLAEVELEIVLGANPSRVQIPYAVVRASDVVAALVERDRDGEDGGDPEPGS